jgi:hypothetical protein
MGMPSFLGNPMWKRDPLELIAETEAWLYAEALSAEQVTGPTPLIGRMRSRATYLRDVREAIERGPDAMFGSGAEIASR